MERLTNIGSNGEIWITDNDETRRYGRKETAYKKLAEYEDLEEQGLLLRLPCKVGDTVWFIGSKCDKCEEDDCYQCPYNRYGNKRDERFIYQLTIEQFRVQNNSIYMVDTDCVWSSSEISINIEQFGKTVFLTKEEAEQKLKEMESD